MNALNILTGTGHNIAGEIRYDSIWALALLPPKPRWWETEISATPPHSDPSRAIYEVAFFGPTGKAQP